MSDNPADVQADVQADTLTRAEAMSFLARAMRLVEAMCAAGVSFPDHEDPIELVHELMARLVVDDPAEMLSSISE